MNECNCDIQSLLSFEKFDRDSMPYSAKEWARINNIIQYCTCYRLHVMV